MLQEARPRRRPWGHEGGAGVLLAACAVAAALAWVMRRVRGTAADDEDDDATGLGVVEHLVAVVPPLG